MLLAAGRGERMRPLTDVTPKPLLTVHGKSLLQWRLQAVLRDGVGPVLINTAWLGEQIEAAFGSHFHTPDQPERQLSLSYSHEGRDFGQALETAGGISRALDALGDMFWVMAGDVYAPDFVFPQAAVARFRASGQLAHLWLVPNPDHNPNGDFAWDAHSGLASSPPKEQPALRYTFSTIGLYRRELFLPPWCELPPGNPQGLRASLAPLLRLAMAQDKVSAELYTGAWTDVGTPQRLAQLNATVRS
jgi:MurNAc alpha-1-phosphate uridylyltransferase